MKQSPLHNSTTIYVQIFKNHHFTAISDAKLIFPTRPINKPLDYQRLSLLPEIINWAKTVQYANDDYTLWIKESCIDSNMDRYTESPFDCAKFIANVLNKLNLFNKEDIKLYREKHCTLCLLSEGCNLLNYFEQVTDMLDGYKYGPVYNVCCDLDNLLEN